MTSTNFFDLPPFVIVTHTTYLQGQTKPQKAGFENLTGNIEFP